MSRNPENQPAPRINQLTFFRFLAALAIIVVHFGMQVLPFSLPVPQSFFKLTNALLAFFFMLSGFVLSVANYNRPLIKKYFYFNRFVRIYPLYLVALLLLVVVRLLSGDRLADVTLSHVLTNLTLTQSIFTENALSLNYPGWSLSAEALFYLLFPFLFQFLNDQSSKKIIWISTGFWAFSVTASILCIEVLKAPYHFTQYFAGLHLNAFVIGVGAGLIFMRHHEQINRIRNDLVFNLAVISLAYIYLVMNESPITHYSNAGVFSPLFLTLILTFSTDRAPFKNILNSRPLILLGEASYSVYILQYSVWMLFFLISNKLGLPLFSNFYTCTIGLVIISIATFRLLERPLMNRYRLPKKHFAK